MVNRASPAIPPSGMSRLRQATRVQRDRYAAGTETGSQTKSAVETVHWRTALAQMGRRAHGLIFGALKPRRAIAGPLSKL
jgi:hypothetical protein